MIKNIIKSINKWRLLYENIKYNLEFNFFTTSNLFKFLIQSNKIAGLKRLKTLDPNFKLIKSIIQNFCLNFLEASKKIMLKPILR